jgi:DNA-3-methyladenine glycosylase
VPDRKSLAVLSQAAQDIAPVLLGWTLSHTTSEGTVSVQLTEVEAYAGTSDPASHAWRGPTPRNAVMWGRAGHLYVYRSHGIHWCANVVTGSEGEASAVLLRAGTVTGGLDLARARRGERVADRSLARGPGCLGQALGLTGDDNGTDLLDGGRLTLRGPTTGTALPVSSGPRVGVSRAAEVPWRFWLDGDPSVSAYRRSARLPAVTSLLPPASGQHRGVPSPSRAARPSPRRSP